MTITSAQDFLFQRIKEMLPQHVSMVDAVSEILHVSSDSAYRRIRGETPLVLEEARQLCNHFHLSLDQLLNVKSNYTLFQADRVHHLELNFQKYLEGILTRLQQVNGFMRKEIIYLSKDLPFFHNFLSEPLFAFHYFFWMKSIIRHPDFEDKHFNMDCLTPELKQMGAEISHLYNIIPSTEIWNTECVNSIIFQLEYYREAGYISSSADVKKIYESLESVIYHLKDQAENGCKFLPGENPQTKKNNYRFFYNRATLGDNTLVAVTEQIKTVFINYDVINYMSTRDEKFCNDIYDDLQALIRRSTLISETSEKQRNIFFSIMLGKINDRKKHLL